MQQFRLRHSVVELIIGRLLDKVDVWLGARAPGATRCKR